MACHLESLTDSLSGKTQQKEKAMFSFTSLTASLAQGNGPSISSILILVLGLLVAVVALAIIALRLCPRASSVHFGPRRGVPSVAPTVALLIRMADLVARFPCQSAPYLAAGSRYGPPDHHRGRRRGTCADSRASLGSRLRARRHRLANRCGGRDRHCPATRHPPTDCDHLRGGESGE